MKAVNSDLDITINRLRDINDPYVQNTLAKMDFLTKATTEAMEEERKPNYQIYTGDLTYTGKCRRIHLSDIRIMHLSVLKDYMTQQEIQTLEVGKETIFNVNEQFSIMAYNKIKACDVLDKIDYPKLSAEINKLISEKKPFRT